MTNVEFNEKYKDHLEDGHYGLDFDILSVTEYLDTLFEELTQDEDFKYYQIKLNFKATRFYSSLSRYENKLIEKKINKLVKEHYGDRY